MRAVASIFISYRRDDAAGQAGRLCDRLNARLGGDRVFMDIEDIRPGQDFVRAIDERVAGCDYLLVVIGPRWLEGLQRRAGTEDFVRHEIAAGLRAGLTVIPVLVGGARMPAARDLPPEVSALARRNAVTLADDRFDDDVARLLKAVGSDARGTSGRPAHARRRLLLAATALVLAAGGAVAMLWPRPQPADVNGTWIAEMQKPGQQPYRIRLTLIQAGDVITGVVNYPTGDGPILDGKIGDGGTITFHTSHVPQFESEPAIIRWVAAEAAEQLRVTTTDAGGVASGMARRIEAP
jgi:hypothetical protein